MQSRVDTRYAAAWFVIATGALMLAGLFSVIPLIGRIPGFSALVTDPWFARRCLVVHVDLALGIWLLAFVMGMFALIPSSRRTSAHDFAAVAFTAVGTLVMVASALLPHAQPIMSNYVPAIDHPAFAAGLIMIAVGLVVAALDGRMWPAVGQQALREEQVAVLPPGAQNGVRAAVLAIVIAILTFVASWLTTPADLEPRAYYERLFWGGGHVLQFAHVAGMIAVWIVLLQRALGRAPISRRRASVIFATLLAPVMLAPLVALRGTDDAFHLQYFTRLMQFGLPVPIISALVLSIHGIILHRKSGSGLRCKNAGLRCKISALHRKLVDAPWVASFAASALLIMLGIGIGIAIRGSNTVVPGHYHAAIGAVTAVYMALTVLLLQEHGHPVQRLAALQPVVFGVGQSVFALGFALAGASGMLRKTYGAEQHVRTWTEWLGLSAMGLGGLLAIVAGLYFLYLVGAAWMRPFTILKARRSAWSIPSRS
jgi:cytochrome c oxidase subunit I